MPKRDLSKQLGERYKTQEAVTVTDPIAAAQAAIAQTTLQPPAPTQPAAEGEDPSTIIKEHARTDTSTHARTRTRTQANKSASTRASTRALLPAATGGIEIETLYEKLQNRKHLSSSTFRYQADELAELEQIFDQLNEEKPGRLSRNDIARLGLIWLCEDFRQNGETSLLEQILKRT